MLAAGARVRISYTRFPIHGLRALLFIHNYYHRAGMRVAGLPLSPKIRMRLDQVATVFRPDFRGEGSTGIGPENGC